MTDRQKVLRFFIPLLLTLVVWFYYSPRPSFIQCFWLIGCFGLWGLAYNGYARLRKREMSFVWWGIGYGIVLGIGCRLIYLMFLMGSVG